MKATIAVIGSLAGVKEELPYMSWNEIKEMQDSGLIDIQNHSWGLHDGSIAEYARKTVLRLDNEKSAAYAELLKKDNANFTSEMVANLGKKPTVFVYPLGKADILSEAIIQEMGYRVTMLTGDRIGEIKKGDPLSLRGLYRINAGSEWSGEELLQKCAG